MNEKQRLLLLVLLLLGLIVAISMASNSPKTINASHSSLLMKYGYKIGRLVGIKQGILRTEKISEQILKAADNANFPLRQYLNVKLSVYYYELAFEDATQMQALIYVSQGTLVGAVLRTPTNEYGSLNCVPIMGKLVIRSP